MATANITITDSRTETELALIDTRSARFERNQSRWVKLIVEGKAPYSSHTLESLQRRKAFLTAWLADQTVGVQRTVARLLDQPTTAVNAGKTLRDSSNTVGNLVTALRDVERAVELVTAYLATYPAESTDAP